jgi:hypothetical protein
VSRAETVLCFAVSWAIVLAASQAPARGVRIPFRFDAPFLAELLEREVFTGPGRTAVVWDDRVCSRLTLASPRVAIPEARLRIETEVDALGGTPFSSWCLLPLRWQGVAELDLSPWLDAERSIVRFRVVDSRYRARSGSFALGLDTVIGWMRIYAHARLEERLAVDLAPALRELGAVLPSFLQPVDERSPVEGLALDAVEVKDETLVAWLRLEVSVAERAQAEPEPALSPAEVDRLRETLRRWDGFVTFVTREAARDLVDPELRDELLAVLLDARHELVDAAASAPDAPDPVRPYFLRTWERLAPLLRRVEQGTGTRTLRWAAFVAAGDALRAIDDLGPATEIDVSADGLRRLARMLVAADFTADPLDYDDEVDPELRRSFGFGEPLEPPRDVSEPPPEPEPPAPGEPRSLLAPGIRRVALALRVSPGAEAPDLRRLSGWVPARSELDDYLTLMRELLQRSGEEALERKPLALPFRSLYRSSLLATAWQETCWRHYVRRRGSVRVIRSSAGALGLMQVLPRVWRGFYDVRALERDVAYNARAGAEILLHYLADHAIRKREHETTRRAEDLARATYAMYNGGPSQLRRYRRTQASPRERAVDESFFEKYRTVSAGRELAVASCFS